MTNDAETGGVLSRLFHRRWSDGKGRTLDPNAEVPVTVTNPLGYYMQDVDN